MLYRGQPKAASVVEFGGGPHAWVSRTFEAREGGGALCNGRKISVSETDDVTRSLLVGPSSQLALSPRKLLYGVFQTSEL